MAQFISDDFKSGGTGQGTYILEGISAAAVPLTVKAYTGQTANVLEVKNAAGTTLFSVDNSGNVTYLGDEYVTDALTVNGNASITGTLGVTGAVTLSSTLGVSGAATFDSGINVTGDSFIEGTTRIHSLRVEGDLNLQSGYIRSLYSANLHLLPGPSCITIVGDAGTTSHTLNTNDDLFVTGRLEVDGMAYFDGGSTAGVSFTDDTPLYFGSSNDAGIVWNTTETVDAWYFGTATAQNTIIIAEIGDIAYDFAHGAQTNPTVFIQSATQSATQWGSLTHDQTDFLISSGAGAVRFSPTTNVTATLPAAGKVYINGTTTRTGTTELLDIDATIDTTTATDDVTCATIVATRGATDTGGTRGWDVTVTTGNMANAEWSYCYGGTYVTSACATATANSAVFFAGTSTVDAQSNDYGIYITAGYDTAGYFGGNIEAAGMLTLAPTTTGNVIDMQLETEWTTGSLINADFAGATTQTGDIIGTAFDFNTNLTGVTDLDVIGHQVKLPALTQSTTNTTAYTGFSVPTAGALVQDTLAGTITWKGVNIQLPNITQTTGTVNSYGIYISGGTVTSGTEYGLYINSADAYIGGALSGITTIGCTGDITISGNTANITHSGTTSLTITSTAGTVIVEGVTFTGAAVSGISTLGMAGDLTDYEAVNDGNPEIKIGSADAEEAHIQVVYDGGAQTLDYVKFTTDVASATADKGRYIFNVDGSDIATIDDGGMEITGSVNATAGFTDGIMTIDGSGAITGVTSLAMGGALSGVTTLGLSAGITQTTTVTGTMYDMALETEWTGGTLINADFGGATVQATDMLGVVLDFNTNLAGVTDLDITGYVVKTPALTQSTANTTTYIGYNLPTAGALVQDTLAGTIAWRGINIQCPNITQTTGAVTSYGIYVNGGTVTSGTQWALCVDSGNARFDNEITVGNDADNYTGKINLIASDGDASDITMNTSDQMVFEGAAGGYTFDGPVSGITTLGLTGDITVTSGATTTDALTITAASLSSGSALVITGPSGGTAGVTDAVVKLTSDIGNCGATNPAIGLISSTATIDTTGAATDTGVNLFLSTVNSNGTNVNTSYGIYNKTTDAIALANTNYGIYTSVANTGAIDTAITKTIYGSYITASGTLGGLTTAGTTAVYGQYIITVATHAGDFGTVNQYGLYIANGTSSTNGTSTKYGVYIDTPTGADTNYIIYSPNLSVTGAGVMAGVTSIGVTGTRIAAAFFTDLAVTNTITGSITGNAATVTVIDTSDTSCYVALFGEASGSLAAYTDTGLTYNAGTGVLTATGFVGPLTGDVTGNCSGTAATVTGATQASITTCANLTTTGTVATGTWSANISSATMTGNITFGEATALIHDNALSVDGKYTGEVVAGTAGAILAFGDLCYLDPTDSKWELTDANAAAGADGDARGLIGICVLAAIEDAATTILLRGMVRADTAFPAITINGPVYVSETAGDVTMTQPATTDNVIRIIGQGFDANTIYLNPSPDWITKT